MPLDTILMGAVGLFAVTGAFSGLIGQLSQWIGLASAYILAKPVGAALGPALASHLGPAAPLASVAGGAAAMPVVYLVVGMVSKILLGRFLPAIATGTANRAGGAVLGAAKAGALAYIGLSVIVSFEAPLNKAGVDLNAKTGNSSALTFARKHNLFASMKLPILDSAKKLTQGRMDPAAAMQMLSNPVVKKMLSDPKFQNILANPALKKSLPPDAAATFEEPQMKEMLADPNFLKQAQEMNSPSPPDTDPDP